MARHRRRRTYIPQVQRFFIKDIRTGLVRVTILTDPFHYTELYDMAPVFLLRGELFDSMTPEQHLCG